MMKHYLNSGDQNPRYFHKTHLKKTALLPYCPTYIQLVTPKVVAIAVNTVITIRKILLQNLRFESLLFPFII